MLIPVMVRLVRAVDWNADIVGLLLREFGQFDAKLIKVQSSNLFIQYLWQDVNFVFVVLHARKRFVTIGVVCQVDLSNRLIGERG